MNNFIIECTRCGKKIAVHKDTKDNTFEQSHIKICQDSIRETVIVECKCGNKAEFY
jgi:hypothetical protein